MRTPRDLSGADLAKLLSKNGYQVVRQRGSHIQLSTRLAGTEHHVTIPAHKPLKVGTLHHILRDVAEYLRISESELARRLFG